MSPATPQRRVLFVCTHNAGRSIVAAALLNAHQPLGVRADSAGTDPSDALNPTVVTALTERGISLAGVSPKPITSELLASADLVITMSRHATGPTLAEGAARRQHWQLGFPGDDPDAMRAFCNQVDRSVQASLVTLRGRQDDFRRQMARGLTARFRHVCALSAVVVDQSASRCRGRLAVAAAACLH